MSRKTTTGEKLAQHSMHIPETSCVIWTGLINDHGYGYLREGRNMVRAHRASYLLHKGEIPEGMVVCHTCDIPSCINPDHLYLGTQKDNMKDCCDKGHLKNRKKKGKYRDAKTILEIIASPKTHVELSKEHNICLTTISKYKNLRFDLSRVAGVAL